MSGTAAGPTGESSAAARSGISRRHLLVGAGVLGVAAAALPLLRATPAMAINLGHPFLGSNVEVYNEILNGLGGFAGGPVPLPRPLPVPGLNGVRKYHNKPTCDPKQTTTCTTVIPPATWPNDTIIDVTVNGVWTTALYSGPTVYSIYPNPMEVSDTTSPTYANLQSLIASAPPHSYLCAWHEALSEPPHPSYITVDSLKTLHNTLNQMCLTLNPTNVTYGAIFGYADTWDTVPNNLGFYGYDAYAPHGISDGMDKLNTWIDGAKSHYTSDSGQLYPGTTANYPNLLIAETNIQPDPTTGDTSQRGPWFEAVCNRMHTYGANAIGVLTFWLDGGPLSGPWLPIDLQTEQAMNDIINSIF